ncbi:hypothetical protein ES708_09710 [subsurface metagenome]
MLVLYDLATELAPKEGKSHRETFDLICQYLELECEIDQKNKLLEETEKRIQQLDIEIKDRRGILAILEAIQQGKVGHG